MSENDAPKKTTKNKPPTTIPHSSKPRTFLLSILKLFYFLVLYNSGYWFTIYIHKVRSRLVIFDRYYHDIIVDPIRYMNGAGVFWSKLLGVFIPKPDLWILLDASPELFKKGNQKFHILKLKGKLMNIEIFLKP